MKRRSQPQLMNVMNVSGLAAVLFVLVFFFFMYQLLVGDNWRDRSVDQVLSSSAEDKPKANREDAMVVTISRDGRIYFESFHVMPDRLTDMIREKLASGSERRVYINADKRVAYGVVDDTLKSVRSAGIEEITFITAQPTRGGKP